MAMVSVSEEDAGVGGMSMLAEQYSAAPDYAEPTNEGLFKEAF